MSVPSFENGWLVPGHDYQVHTGTTATTGPTQVVYKKGGASGKVAATENITHDGNGYVATRSIDWEPDIYV